VIEIHEARIGAEICCRVRNASQVVGQQMLDLTRVQPIGMDCAFPRLPDDAAMQGKIVG